MDIDKEHERRMNRICTVQVSCLFGWWITLAYIFSFTNLSFETCFYLTAYLPLLSPAIFTIHLIFGCPELNLFGKIHYICSIVVIVLGILIIFRYFLEFVFVRWLLNVI